MESRKGCIQVKIEIKLKLDGEKGYTESALFVKHRGTQYYVMKSEIREAIYQELEKK